MLYWLFFALFGLIVGLIAKALHPGEDPVGFLPTIGIGIAGSYIGGIINYVIGAGSILSPSGLIMSVLGGVILCWGYRKYRLDRMFKMQQLKMQNKKDK